MGVETHGERVLQGGVARRDPNLDPCCECSVT